MGKFEQEWRRWYPHDDDPPEIKVWGEQHREFIFEQLMKTHKNLPKDMPLPNMTSSFDGTTAIWVTFSIAVLIMICAMIILK